MIKLKCLERLWFILDYLLDTLLLWCAMLGSRNWTFRDWSETWLSLTRMTKLMGVYREFHGSKLHWSLILRILELMANVEQLVCIYLAERAVCIQLINKFLVSLQWRHNEGACASNIRRPYYLLNRLFRRRSKKTSKLRITGFCVGNSSVNSPHKGPIKLKMLPFDDVIMCFQNFVPETLDFF